MCAAVDKLHTGHVGQADLRSLLARVLNVRLADDDWFELLTELDQLADNPEEGSSNSASGPAPAPMFGQVSYVRLCRHLERTLGAPSRKKAMGRERARVLAEYDRLQAERRAQLLARYRDLKTKVQKPTFM